jgi:hypothetical protein
MPKATAKCAIGLGFGLGVGVKGLSTRLPSWCLAPGAAVSFCSLCVGMYLVARPIATKDKAKHGYQLCVSQPSIAPNNTLFFLVWPWYSCYWVGLVPAFHEQKVACLVADGDYAVGGSGVAIA